MMSATEATHVGGISPTSISAPAAPIAGRRRAWYRRKRFAIPVAFLIILALAGGVVGWRISDSFSTINRVSTPPPVVTGDKLGGHSSIGIDTGPAQQAVKTYEAAKQGRAEHRAEQGSAPTNESNDLALVTTPTEQAGNPAADDPTPTATETETETESDDVASNHADDLTPTMADVDDEDESTEPTATADDILAPIDEPTATAIISAPSPTVEPESGDDTLDVLLMGVDALEGEAIDIGVRPDALVVLHLDKSDGSCRMLAIPRDTRVELPGYGLSKINHALAVGGVPYEQQVVEQYLGIELDHYGLIDFSGVVQIVDTVGGVEIDNPAAFTASDGKYFPAGVQTLDGERALAYARFRGDAQGDFGRIGRQQEVLRALMQKVSPGDLVGMIPQMLPLLQDHFRTDLSAFDLVDLARDFGTSCTSDTLETSTLEGTTATYFDPLLELNLSYVIIDEAELRNKRDWLLGT